MKIKNILTLLVAMLLTSVAAIAQYNPTNPAEPGVYYTLTLKSFPEGAGSFNIAAQTTQSMGVGVNLRAYANTGFRFVCWEENGKVISNDASFNFTMRGANTTLIARYEYDPSSPSEPSKPNIPVYTYLDVNVSPSGSGTVNVGSGNKYEVGSSVQLRATPTTNFSFVNWTQDDEIISTSTSFNYVVKNENGPITANFKYSPGSPGEPGKPTFQRKLYLNTNPQNAGYFNISSGNTYNAGSSVALKAYANKDYEFLNWTENGEIISESYSFNYTMPESDVTLTANYKYVYSPSNPGEPSSPSTTDLNIYSVTETVYSGQTINFPIYLRNALNVYGIIIDVKFPDGFTPDWNGIILSGRSNGHEIYHEEIDGYTRVSIEGSAPFSSDDGKILDIPVKADSDIEGNKEYIVELSHGVVILDGTIQVPVTARDGGLLVEYAPAGTVYARYSYDKFQNRVQFSNQSAPEAISFTWDFGDGTSSHDENPLHIYSSPGTYIVKLSVSNGNSNAEFLQNVLINDESTWVASGNFYLGQSGISVRSFDTFDQLLTMLSNSRIDGDVIVNVESGKDFYISLTSLQQQQFRNVISKFETGGNTWIFLKSGTLNNPVISYGNPGQPTFEKNVTDLIIELGKIQKYYGVEVKLWGVSFDSSQIPLLEVQDVCTGIKTNEINFSLISTEMEFTWKVSDVVNEGLGGYKTSGTGSIPSMSITNEAYGDANFTYIVTCSYGGHEIVTFPVYITVHPALVGLFSTLEPKSNSQFENGDITLSWNNIENAVYDVYLWNANEEKPDNPIVTGTSSIKTNVSKYCTNGNKYNWQIVARNHCQELYSDILSFQIGSLPNLHVSKLEVGEAVAGKEMTVSWTVTNDGTGNTGNIEWNDNIWLVPDVYVGTSAVYLDTQRFHPKLLKTVSNIKALEPGESYTNSVKVELEERVYGDYYIIAASDMHDVKNIQWQTVNNTVPLPYTPSITGSPYPYLYAETTSSYNKVSEANETSTRSDNFNYAKINIAVPGLVDLTVTEITAEVNNAPGTVFTAGAKAKTSETGTIDVYSTDSTDYGWSTDVGNFRYYPTPHTTIGLAESKEFYSGKYLKVTATVKNIGGLKLERTTFTNALFISHSPTLENADDLTAVALKDKTTFLDPGGTTKIYFDCQIPYDWFGETYFYVNTDINDQVYELSSKQNNWGKSSRYDFKLTPGADFVPSDLKAPETVASQVPFNVSYKVKNIGPNIPTTKSEWTDYIYLSKKDVFDNTATKIGEATQRGSFTYTLVGNPGGGVLAHANDYKYSGDNYNVEKSIKIDKIEEGDYYLFVEVDAKNDVFEENGENNNVIRSGIISCRVPDLQVEFLGIETDTIVTNTPVAFSWKIKNTGRGVVKNLKTLDEIYASKNQDGANAILLGKIENELFINPDDEQIIRANITIPQNSNLDGVQYVFINVNTKRDIQETSYTNNRSELKRTWFEFYEEKPVVTKGTNISIQSPTLPKEGNPNETVTISYKLNNSGNKKVDRDVSQEVFISKKQSYDSSAIPCKIFSQQGTSAGLGAEDATDIMLKVEVPGNIMGGKGYFMHLVIDRKNELGETYTSDNYKSWAFNITGNLPRIEISNLQMPDTIMTSNDVVLNWTVTNSGTWDAGKFEVGIYRGNDKLSTLNVSSLAKGASVKQSTKINIEDKFHGKWNFKILGNSNDLLEELVSEKSSITKPVIVELAPLPDLYVSSFKSEGTAWSGQSITLTTKFANKGINATRQTKWSEDYYLASSNIFNPSAMTKIGSRVHNGILEAGAEYTSIMTVTIPPGLEGNYMIFVMVDGGNAVYESDEDNNYRSIPLFINGKNVTATDLIISNLSCPSQINAGEEFTLSYKIINQGEFEAKGLCREVLYLSKDNVFDNDDIMVGTVSGNIDILPGGNLTRTATGRIINMPEGDYYLIVKANSTKAIAETNEDNNTAVLPGKVRINFPSLSLNGSVPFNTSGYYKLPVDAITENKTISFTLEHSVEDNAGIYVAFEKVPSTASYDDCSTRTRTTSQEVIIPDVKSGNYYILAQDNATVINKDNYAFSLTGSDNRKKIPLSLSARELQFGASSLSISQGGNGGWLTTNIKGALLDSIMDFRLKNNDFEVPVEMLHYKGSTSTMATFNLNNVELGRYDVVSELPDGTQATLKNGFSVVPATSVNVEVKLDGPSQYRLNSYAPMSLAYFNNGTNDVELYELMLTIDDGYIAASYEELDRNQQKGLHFRPNFERNNRGFISLPPGERCVLTFFIKTGMNMENNVSVYVVK